MTSDAETMKSLEAMFLRLPVDKDAPKEITRRIRIVTEEGRTIFAFLRAGTGPLSFAGWDATREATESGELREPRMEYFVLTAQAPGAPLCIITRRGLLGAVRSVDAEERPAEAETS
jgi:hypothetical protein